MFITRESPVHYFTWRYRCSVHDFIGERNYNGAGKEPDEPKRSLEETLKRVIKGHQGEVAVAVKHLSRRASRSSTGRSSDADGQPYQAAGDDRDV